MFMYFDPMYLLFMAPALILAGIASSKTKGTFKKYSKIAASSKLTGAQAARKMLDINGLSEVKLIELVVFYLIIIIQQIVVLTFPQKYMIHIPCHLLE